MIAAETWSVINGRFCKAGLSASTSRIRGGNRPEIETHAKRDRHDDRPELLHLIETLEQHVSKGENENEREAELVHIRVGTTVRCDPLA